MCSSLRVFFRFPFPRGEWALGEGCAETRRVDSKQETCFPSGRDMQLEPISQDNAQMPGEADASRVEHVASGRSAGGWESKQELIYCF